MISIPAVLVAALASFIIGFLFHMPPLGNIWMRLANITPTGNEKLSDMWRQMLANYLIDVVVAFVMAGAFWLVFASPLMGPATWYRGAILAAWLWLGFIATTNSVNVIWMGQSKKLWLFEAVASLTAMLAMGAILAVW